MYAFDAETNTTDGGLLWGPISLGTPVPTSEICSANVSPSFGVTGTPVIDTVTGTLYLVSKNKLGSGDYAARLHALDLSSGAEKFGGRVDISGSVPRTAGGDPTVTFDPLRHFQRSALLLYGGSVYVAFGSHCDQPDYHGWMFGYEAANITTQTAIFNTTPNALTRNGYSGCPGYKNKLPAGGAIWMAGAGPAASRTGIYVTTGNGHFDGNTAGGIDFGDTVLKLGKPEPADPFKRLTVADYFTPHDQQSLECNDNDFGSSGPMVLPYTDRSFLIQTSKYGSIYLINRTTGSMGKYDNGCNPSGPGCDHVVQVIHHAIGGEVQSSPAFFDGAVYFQGQKDPMKKFTIIDGMFAPTTPVAEAATPLGMSATPSISSDASAPDIGATGIVWAIEKSSTQQAVLHAYTADTLRELYNSGAQGVRDAAGTTVNFTVPTVAAGKVFVGTRSRLVVFGAGYFKP
ncbi:MAG: hypothetical protein M3O06_01070 [Pseudomonadota bacterium]|nr:hypothetical protein [Pseudomonadota bacterium]